jgi:molybdopterin molybdotransferase
LFLLTALARAAPKRENPGIMKKQKGETMISYENALKEILEYMRTMEAEEKRLLACTGQVTAEPVYADIDLPLRDVSGPDGYAVRSADIRSACRKNPVTLRVTETVRAGRMTRKPVKAGTAVRIMTGSIIPRGADCVVWFEDTDEPKDKNGPNKAYPTKVKIYAPATPGDNIRPAGSNIRRGSLVVPKGTLIGPSQVSALAITGKIGVRVIRRPVIAIIATGDELVNPGRSLPPGSVYNANAAAIASFVAHYGGMPKILGIARDRQESLLAKITKAAAADAIVTSGGVSMGDYDLVRLVLEKIGKVVFPRINMGPGASVAFGLIDRSREEGGPPVPIFALSGPPSGCLINLETLVGPALMKMRGLSVTSHPVIEAVATDAHARRIGIPFVRWTELKRVNGEYRVTLNLTENRGVVASMATANSLTIIPENSTVNAGDIIRVLPLDWCRHGLCLPDEPGKDTT